MIISTLWVMPPLSIPSELNAYFVYNFKWKITYNGIVVKTSSHIK